MSILKGFKTKSKFRFKFKITELFLNQQHQDVWLFNTKDATLPNDKLKTILFVIVDRNGKQRWSYLVISYSRNCKVGYHSDSKLKYSEVGIKICWSSSFTVSSWSLVIAFYNNLLEFLWARVVFLCWVCSEASAWREGVYCCDHQFDILIYRRRFIFGK